MCNWPRFEEQRSLTSSNSKLAQLKILAHDKGQSRRYERMNGDLIGRIVFENYRYRYTCIPNTTHQRAPDLFHSTKKTLFTSSLLTSLLQK